MYVNSVLIRLISLKLVLCYNEAISDDLCDCIVEQIMLTNSPGLH